MDMFFKRTLGCAFGKNKHPYINTPDTSQKKTNNASEPTNRPNKQNSSTVTYASKVLNQATIAAGETN